MINPASPHLFCGDFPDRIGPPKTKLCLIGEGPFCSDTFLLFNPTFAPLIPEGFAALGTTRTCLCFDFPKAGRCTHNSVLDNALLTNDESRTTLYKNELFTRFPLCPLSGLHAYALTTRHSLYEHTATCLITPVPLLPAGTPPSRPLPKRNSAPQSRNRAPPAPSLRSTARSRSSCSGIRYVLPSSCFRFRSQHHCWQVREGRLGSCADSNVANIAFDNMPAASECPPPRNWDDFCLSQGFIDWYFTELEQGVSSPPAHPYCSDHLCR